MRRLMLLRHAETPRPEGVSDRDRPLGPSGRAEARSVGHLMERERLVPDLALVSPARRTQETWDIARSLLGRVETRVEARLYEASDETLLAVIREVEPTAGALILVGHNPGCEDLARLLVDGGNGDRDGMVRLRSHYPPAGLAVIDLSVDEWRAAAPRSGRLERFVSPDEAGAGRDR